ncbi:MAG: hypothetical protein A2W02_03220 [Alphaproteobacteria bacterium RBG_16_64_48]|nr:MAG: hypothetical protein A2W02_03220 [Alphaproteobacteria bacterium RBG_16_64_48]
MVTAGVFMVARLSPLYELAPIALGFVAIIGATTAFFAATVGLVQTDIKRVVAYSTCSQLGYMFAAEGVGAYGAGMFHLFTHASFKALLFLGAGAVIHALHHEQDLRRMGALRKVLPFTWAMMLVGTLSLTGFPFTAGFVSKDAIIEATYAAQSWVGNYAFVLTLFAAMLTSFYSWRLMFLAFEGKPREPKEVLEHAHEPPWTMGVPLVILALGALLTGGLFFHLFIGAGQAEFWRGSLVTHTGEHHEVPVWVMLAPPSPWRQASPWPGISTSPTRWCPSASPSASAGPTSSCSTLGISTRSTMRCSCGRRNGSAASCGRLGTAPSSMVSALTGSRRASSTSPTAWSSSRPAISITTPSSC